MRKFASQTYHYFVECDITEENGIYFIIDCFKTKRQKMKQLFQLSEIANK